MFWSEQPLGAYEETLRGRMTDLFVDYPRIVSAVRAQPFGLTAASHLAHRIRLSSQGQGKIDEDRIEEEFTATVAALSSAGALDRNTCFSPGLDGFESEIILAIPEACASATTIDGVQQAKLLISRSSFAYVNQRLDDIAIIALDFQKFPATNQSYTIQAVLNTIYLDIYESAILTAESIVHEHAHLCFNNFVTHKSLLFDPAPLYYSPWKEKKRPLFNFLHSLIAFSEVVLFMDELSKWHLDGMARRYVDMKLSFEMRNIDAVGESAKRALCSCPDIEASALIQRALNRISSL